MFRAMCAEQFDQQIIRAHVGVCPFAGASEWSS
jgi:hypothetical protein